MRRRWRRLRERGPVPRLLAAKLGTTHFAPSASLLPAAGVRGFLAPTPNPPSWRPPVGELSWQAELWAVPAQP